MLRFGSNESNYLLTLALVCCGAALAMSGCASDDDPRRQDQVTGRPGKFDRCSGGRDNGSAHGNALTPAYLSSLANTGAVEAATIAVKNIAGPILLTSAEDDSIWPSRAMSEAIMTRLANSNHPYADVHLTYDNAGHLIPHPFLPTSLLQFGLNLFGGTPAATATACIESWREVSEFLSVNLE